MTNLKKKNLRCKSTSWMCCNAFLLQFYTLYSSHRVRMQMFQRRSPRYFHILLLIAFMILPIDGLRDRPSLLTWIEKDLWPLLVVKRPLSQTFSPTFAITGCLRLKKILRCLVLEFVGFIRLYHHFFRRSPCYNVASVLISKTKEGILCWWLRVKTTKRECASF